ncbi:unnamed protein product [Alternaria alternata]
MLAQFDLRLAPIRSESRRLLTFPIEDHDPAAFGHQAVSPEALAQVGEVLRTHKFSSLDRYLSVRSHPNQATNAIIPTFIIETNCQGRDTTVIGTVVDPVQNIFSCLPIEVMIEVIDRDWVADMATGPIRTTDLDAIQAWDRCCEDAVEFPRTQEQRGVNFATAFTLIHQSLPSGKNPSGLPANAPAEARKVFESVKPITTR